MKTKMSTAEIKQTGVNLLKKIDSFCKANNIQYFLCYGTLLGAVRHKGFIPWDDDIDIMMPSKDYKKFVEIARDGVGDSTKLLYPEYNATFYRPFARIFDTTTNVQFTSKKMDDQTGIWIDIFPLEGLPNNKLMQKLHFQIQSIYRYMIIAHFKENSSRSKSREIVRKVFKAIITPKICRKLVLRTMKRSSKYKYEESQFVGVSVAAYKTKNIIKREDIEPATNIEFEGLMLNAPRNYENYLKTIYNDFRKLPPIKDQVPHHDFIAYKIEE